MKRKFLLLLAVAAVACWASGAYALTETLNIPSTDPSKTLDASAFFSLDTDTHILTLTLTNTSTVNTPNNANILYALFWQGCDDTNAAVTNVELTSGSKVYLFSPPTKPAADVTADYIAGGDPGTLNGTWGYGNGFDLSSVPGFTTGAYSGVSAVGYSLTDGTPNFPSSVDGAGFGLLSAGYDPANPKAGENNPEIKNGVVLTIDNFNCDLNDLKNITFSYGTTIGDNVLVPLPGALLLLGGGLVRLVAYGRRRKQVAA